LKEDVERKQKCDGGCNNSEHQTIEKIRWMAQREWHARNNKKKST
jgi:hypothetical protein